MKSRHRILSVLMNGILIGQLEKATKGGLTFIYDQTWLNTILPKKFPTNLSQPIFDGMQLMRKKLAR